MKERIAVLFPAGRVLEGIQSLAVVSWRGVQFPVWYHSHVTTRLWLPDFWKAKCIRARMKPSFPAEKELRGCVSPGGGFCLAHAEKTLVGRWGCLKMGKQNVQPGRFMSLELNTSASPGTLSQAPPPSLGRLRLEVGGPPNLCTDWSLLSKLQMQSLHGAFCGSSVLVLDLELYKRQLCSKLRSLGNSNSWVFLEATVVFY